MYIYINIYICIYIYIYIYIYIVCVCVQCVRTLFTVKYRTGAHLQRQVVLILRELFLYTYIHICM